MNTKICSKCGIEKDISEFYMRGDTGKLRNECKKCMILASKQRYKDDIDRIKKQRKQHRKNNPEKIAKQQQQGHQKDIKQRRCRQKQYRNNSALFKTYSKKLEVFEEVRQCPEKLELLEVKCAYCGKWMLPTNAQVTQRLQAFSGDKPGEQRFYCSEACKISCPTYKQVKYWKGQAENRLGTSREVDAWFRQYVLEADSWTCQICGSSKEEFPELILHVHHTRGVAQQPMLQNDIAYVFTACLDCHKRIHKKEGCTYFDLRRSECEH